MPENQKGWIFGSLIRETGKAKVLSDKAIVRAKSNQQADQIEQLAKGVTVTITDRTDVQTTIGKTRDYWYQVKSLTGKEGWVFGGLLLNTHHRLILGQNVNAREQPNTKANVVATLKKDNTLAVLDRSKDQEKIGTVQDYWYQVEIVKGKPGWVFGEYLMPIKE
jgi:SH3-like domain-containing protein